MWRNASVCEKSSLLLCFLCYGGWCYLFSCLVLPPKHCVIVCILHLFLCSLIQDLLIWMESLNQITVSLKWRSESSLTVQSGCRRTSILISAPCQNFLLGNSIWKTYLSEIMRNQAHRRGTVGQSLKIYDLIVRRPLQLVSQSQLRHPA